MSELGEGRLLPWTVVDLWLFYSVRKGVSCDIECMLEGRVCGSGRHMVRIELPSLFHYHLRSRQMFPVSFQDQFTMWGFKFKLTRKHNGVQLLGALCACRLVFMLAQM